MSPTLVHEPPRQALTATAAPRNLQVVAARSLQRRGGRFPYVTGEVRDIRVRLFFGSVALFSR
jgi:hypothetical protein